jgi:hypothetical protein
MIIPPELRAQIKKKVPFFDTAVGKCTGLDWNLLAKIVGDSCLGMTKAEYIATLKYNLDQRLKGTRAPLLFGAHSQFYTSQSFSDLGAPNITYQEMRSVIQDFIKYALTKADVRIVPIIKILEWCKNPVGLNNSGVTASGNSRITHATITCRNKTIFIQLSHADKDRDVTLRLFDLQGRLITAQKYANTGLIQMNVGSLSARGVYVLQILTGRDVITDRISGN